MERESLGSLDCSGDGCIDRADLKLIEIGLSLLPSAKIKVVCHHVQNNLRSYLPKLQTNNNNNSSTIFCQKKKSS